MAQLNQVGESPVLVLACKNSSGSAIAEGLAVMLDTYAAGVITVKLTASDVGAMGVAMEAIADGKVGRVMVGGVASCTASATITSAAGTAVVMTDSAGKVLAQTAGKYQLGFALQDAVSGDRVAVLLAPAKNA